MSSSQEQTQEQNTSIESFKYSKRVVLKSILDREDKGHGLVGRRVIVGGWVKSKKEKKDKTTIVASLKESKEEEEGGGRYVTCFQVILSRIPILRSVCNVVARRDGVVGKNESPIPSTAYLKINDGSCVHNLRVVIDSSMSLLHQVITVGSSVLLDGILEQPAIQGKHDLQLKVENILHVGVVDPKNYPLAKKRLSLDFIRAYPHLRPRSATIASITRIRSTLSYAAHSFLHENGFVDVHIPVISSSSTNITEGNSGAPRKAEESNENVRLEVIKASMEEKSNQVEELKRSSSNKEALLDAIKDLQKTNELVALMEEKQKESLMKVGEPNHVNKDLICNKELYLESYACALSTVYTFGPILKSEHSRTLGLSTEMWRVEVELAFAELEDAMNCSEDLLKYMFQSTLNDCPDDMKFLSKRIDKNRVDRLQSIVSSPFARITYTEALEYLKNVNKELQWGVELTKEHESYLANKIFKEPIIIHDYPKEVKPFYVHVKEDGRTASAFDIIAPKVGALVRGSQKEEKTEKIKARIEEVGLPQKQHEWYLDIRRHGTVKHSGFRVEFENVVLFATGLDDIRDAIPFPCSSDSVNI